MLPLSTHLFSHWSIPLRSGLNKQHFCHLYLLFNFYLRFQITRPLMKDMSTTSIGFCLKVVMILPCNTVDDLLIIHDEVYPVAGEDKELVLPVLNLHLQTKDLLQNTVSDKTDHVFKDLCTKSTSECRGFGSASF
jgi:hypothetical protein